MLSKWCLKEKNVHAYADHWRKRRLNSSQNDFIWLYLAAMKMQGKFVRGATRGQYGYVGEDITENLKMINLYRALVLKGALADSLEVRGEALLGRKPKMLNKLSKRLQRQAAFANIRNVAGACGSRSKSWKARVGIFRLWYCRNKGNFKSNRKHSKTQFPATFMRQDTSRRYKSW